MKIWAKTEEFSEGKYLVVRRDGTTPDWPHFVIGGDDPCAAAALRAYANEARKRGLETDYVHSIDDLASDFERRTGGKADPDKGPHRTDLPLAIAMMRRQTDVAAVSAELASARHQLAQSQAEVGRLQAALEQSPERAELHRLRMAVNMARSQFQFYADEHAKADKAEKAATNRRFADALQAALAPDDAGGGDARTGCVDDALPGSAEDWRSAAGSFLPDGRTAACADMEADLPTLAHTLAEQARADDPHTPPGKVFSAPLRWEKNVLYLGKLKVGNTWSSAAGQHGFLLTIHGDQRADNAHDAEGARAALESAVLALAGAGE
jgi:hypothetical protein